MSELATKAPITHPDRFYIGGEWVAPSSSATLDVIDSNSEEVFLTVAEAQAADIERAVAAARHAFDTGPWPRLSHAERADWLRRIAAEIRARAADVACCWTVESGMLHSQAMASIATVAGGRPILSHISARM
jgi:aldehyde dehydrogenase (NAD+)